LNGTIEMNKSIKNNLKGSKSYERKSGLSVHDTKDAPVALHWKSKLPLGQVE